MSQTMATTNRVSCITQWKIAMLIRECEFLYDLKLPDSTSPDYIKLRPHDDEVESFKVG